MDDAVTINDDGGLLGSTSHLGSVHTFITIRAGSQFTHAADTPRSVGLRNSTTKALARREAK